MSKKLSRAERKELRQKALKSPVRALRPQAQKQGTSTKETVEQTAKPQAASAATSTNKGDERLRVSPSTRPVPKGSATSAAVSSAASKGAVPNSSSPASKTPSSASKQDVSAPTGNGQKRRKPHIVAVLAALVIGAGLISYLGPKLGASSQQPKEEIKAESQQPPPAPTKQEAPPPAPVEHAGNVLPDNAAIPTSEAPSAAPPASEAPPSASAPASASSPPTTPSSAPSASAAASAPATPKTPKKPKLGAPKIVTEDPYN